MIVSTIDRNSCDGLPRDASIISCLVDAEAMASLNSRTLSLLAKLEITDWSSIVNWNCLQHELGQSVYSVSIEAIAALNVAQLFVSPVTDIPVLP